jgi:predicted homoserine dehydrogenase-like protein
LKISGDIQIGLIGAGSVGTGVYHQAMLTRGISCAAICDIDIGRAEKLLRPGQLGRRVESAREAAQALASNEIALCQDASIISETPGIDVFFDCSTALGAAPGAIELAMASGKHVIMMNAEADALFGPWFWHLAQRYNVAYSSSDGDQPAVIARLIEETELYGFQTVMAGNIKGFLDRYTDPVKIRPEADKRGLDYQMCSSYTDGTKLCVEMSIVANALGATVATAGMFGPRMDEAHQLFDHFDLNTLWSPGDAPVVDYILGAKPRGGVFVVGYTDDDYQRKMLDWFPPEIGPGPFYVLTRPYHLIHLETMRTVFEVCNTGKSLIAPRHGMKTDVICYAKRPLQAGDSLDGPGGFATYGLIENHSDSVSRGLPILLSSGVKLKKSRMMNERITWDDIDESTMDPRSLEAWGKACQIAG